MRPRRLPSSNPFQQRPQRGDTSPPGKCRPPGQPVPHSVLTWNSFGTDDRQNSALFGEKCSSHSAEVLSPSSSPSRWSQPPVRPRHRIRSPASTVTFDRGLAFTNLGGVTALASRVGTTAPTPIPKIVVFAPFHVWCVALHAFVWVTRLRARNFRAVATNLVLLAPSAVWAGYNALQGRSLVFLVAFLQAATGTCAGFSSVAGSWSGSGSSGLGRLSCCANNVSPPAAIIATHTHTHASSAGRAGVVGDDGLGRPRIIFYNSPPRI